ncbi:MAG TPA: SRPBCC family protein [Caulobacteraceae bacterium]|nr:SRPBCC family protein [Caulobacteraceae bacterium]
MSSKVLVALRVAAPPERAFAVFTEDIGLWWRDNPLFRFTPRSPGVLSFEAGEGGRLVEILPGGRVFEIGRITCWAPPARLSFGWRQASFHPEQQTQVDVRFEPLGEETRITVEHHGWESVPQAHVARHHLPDLVFMRRHGEWWQALLVAYKARLSQAKGP